MLHSQGLSNYAYPEPINPYMDTFKVMYSTVLPFMQMPSQRFVYVNC